MTRWFRVQAIGHVERPPHDDAAAWVDPQEVVRLVIDERWIGGLAGIEEYSHLVVLFYLDRVARRRTAGANRPAEGNPALPPVGFFATRTPKRPNPIGVACPRLLRREGNILVVSGIDAWHQTPLIDIKGYSLRDEMRSLAIVPDWLTSLWQTQDIERRRS